MGNPNVKSKTEAAAVLDVARDAVLLATTDLIVEDVHFPGSYCTPPNWAYDSYVERSGRNLRVFRLEPQE